MIEVKNLHKSFGAKKVLEGVNLTIPNGSAKCIIGKSGCGKSVLLKNIVGLLVPDEGEVLVDGKRISDLKNGDIYEIRKKMGFVFQGSALFDSLNVFENVVLRLYEHGQRNTDELEKEALRVLTAVGLLPEKDSISKREYKQEWEILRYKKPSDLSGGMKKRVGVARALAGSPDYIFYDEPTTGLDPVTSEQVDNLIAKLSGKLSVTSIVITHDMFSVLRIADDVAMLDKGKIRFEGKPQDMMKSDDPAVREFLERYKRN
jgi:phospholipid/cholesterol/gamma-HCH transport system ATP-binding protein